MVHAENKAYIQVLFHLLLLINTIIFIPAYFIPIPRSVPLKCWVLFPAILSIIFRQVIERTLFYHIKELFNFKATNIAIFMAYRFYYFVGSCIFCLFPRSVPLL